MAPGEHLQQIACPLPHGGGVEIPLNEICLTDFAAGISPFALLGLEWSLEVLLPGGLLRFNPDICQARRVMGFGYDCRIITTPAVLKGTHL